MKSIIPKKGTPTAKVKGIYFRGKRKRIDGVTFWLKGESPVGYKDKDANSPYYERAAYLVSRMLRLRLVPYTAITLENGKVASAQRWVKGKRPTMRVTALLEVFDYIIANTDRHHGNWLISRGRVRAIDNALSFGCGDLIHNDLRRYIDELSTTERAELMERLELVLADQEKLHKRFDCLIGKRKTDALIDRMRTVWLINRNERKDG